MSNSFESNLIKIPAKEVVDELYGKPPTKGEKDIAEFRKKKIQKPEKTKNLDNQEYSEQIENWQNFYQETFKMETDFSELEIPVKREGFDKLIVLAKGMTAQKLFDKCQELFPSINNDEKDLDKTITSDRNAKEESYAIWIRDRIEADEELKGLSAVDVEDQKIIAVTLEERLLQELEYFSQTKEHLDKQTATLCAGSRYDNGGVPRVGLSNDGRRYVSWGFANYKNDWLRPREAVALVG